MKMSFFSLMTTGLLVSAFSTSKVLSAELLQNAKQSFVCVMSSASTAMADSVKHSTSAAGSSLSAVTAAALVKTKSFGSYCLDGVLHVSSIAIGARMAQLHKIDRNKLLFVTAYTAALRAGIQFYKGTSYPGIIGDMFIHTAEMSFGFATRYFYDLMVGEKKAAASAQSNSAAASAPRPQQSGSVQLHIPARIVPGQ